MKHLVLSFLCSLCLFAGGKPATPLPGDAVPWEKDFRAVAGTCWIERAAQVQAESGWNQYAKSAVGAEGPVQVMPTTRSWWIKMNWIPSSVSAYDIPGIFKGQNEHMLWLRRYWPDLDHRLGAYNAGQGSILRADDYAEEMGYEGPNAWLRALARVTGITNAKQTQSYIDHNRENRATITAKLKQLKKTP